MKIYLVIYEQDFREYKVKTYDELIMRIDNARLILGDPKVIYLLREE